MKKSKLGPSLAGIVAMLAVLLIPLSVIAVLDKPAPELRVVSTWDRATVLIVDGDTRVLVINTDDREFARALNGRLSRPWEPGPRLLISPAGDGAAIGLWETLQRTEPTSVVVAGIPGANPLWDAIERECRERDITLSYASGRSSLATERLVIEILAPEPEEVGDRVVVIERDATRVVIALDDALPAAPAHVLIGSGGAGVVADLVITGEQSTRASTTHEVVVGSRDVVRVVMSSSLRVFGGTLRLPVAAAGP